ncbi:odorant receptor 4-like [Leguminivora glycinivorella]|uniref:odorant receptor 4-like n=1 Tax=Leguminivora glycinivorella TaxID=1035111 RepID=UPI00200DE1EA|nr:odorant receptor 4-like [Leguminivora glycinivorella]
MSLLFDESMKKIKLIFKIVGIYLDRRITNTTEHIIKFRSLCLINIVWLGTCIAGEVVWIIDGILTGKSLQEITYMVPCTTYCTLACITYFNVLLNENKVNNLCKQLRDIENNNMDHIGSNEVENKIISKYKKNLKTVINVVITLNALTVISFVASTLVLIGMDYVNTGEIMLQLPFLVAYPFDPYYIKYWPIAYVHQVWTTTLVAFAILGTDCLLCTCCTSICIQFRLLQKQFETIIPERSFNGNIFLDKLKKLVDRHEKIIQAVALLEYIYTKLTLLNFVSSSLLICLTGFNVAATRDIVVIITFLTFLLMSLLRTYLLCFCGDMVMTSSTGVSNAVYNSKWYTVNAMTAKYLHVIQMRAQLPSKLTAYGFADVNMVAFSRILSTAWSYFTLLNTMESST